MSFGFSVGDFLAVGKLATDIVSSLKDAGGSCTEYQALIRELECLQSALVHLDKLAATGTSQDLTAIKYAALSCRHPLEEFLARIRKYDRSLEARSRPNPIQGVIDKIKFPLAHRDEVQRLQAYLSVHIGSINILLAEYGLEKMQLAAERTETGHLQIKKWLENTGDLLGRVQTSIVSQTQAIFQNMAMLERVYKTIRGELSESLLSFENAVAKACVSTQQIYAVVLEIQTSITSTPDIRWAFFQDPLIVEDALGRKFPVPSEYDYSLLDSIIKHKFQDGPGAAQVAVGDYEMMDARNRLHILSVNSRLRPGCSITMAVLVSKPRSAVLIDEGCPMPRCQSSNTTAVPGGGRKCGNCDVWFDQSKKKLSSLDDLWAAYEILSALDQSTVGTYLEIISGKKRKRTHDDDFSIVPFKHVKLADCEAATEKGALNASLAPSKPPIDSNSTYNDFDDLESPDEDARSLQSAEVLGTGLVLDYAIHYVEKVHARFRSTPEIWWRFLQIITTFRREGTPIQRVFNEVTRLLQSAPDLVEDFKQFLPESALRQIKHPEGSADEESSDEGSSDESAEAIEQLKC